MTTTKGTLWKRSKTIIRGFYHAFPRFFAYQVITKIVLGLILFPGFAALLNLLLRRAGYVSLNNTNFLAFMLKPEGILLLLAALVSFLLIFVLEVGGYLTISSREIHHRNRETFFGIFVYNVKRYRQILGMGLIYAILFLVILGPLVGENFGISPLAGLRIPNFITGVIEKNKLYNFLYSLGIFLGSLLLLRWSFAFHFMVLDQTGRKDAFRQSASLMKGRYIKVLLQMGVLDILVGFLFLVAELAAIGIPVILSAFSGNETVVEFFGITGFTLAYFIGVIFTFVAVPFRLYALTHLYYEFLREDKDPAAENVPEIYKEKEKNWVDRILGRKRTIAVLMILFFLITGGALTLLAKADIFDRHPKIIGHRGGAGDGAPENSLEAVKISQGLKADGVEVDVQRAGDGTYIINHDPTFSRLAGNPGSPQGMTLEEIKTLDLGATSNGKFHDVRVPTVEELFAAGKGNLYLFVELKGDTADEKMADDMVALSKSMGMEKEMLFMSLDLNLIKYIEEKYPEMETGFVFFVSFGTTERLPGDFLIIEEDAATPARVAAIQANGKKVAVWTVNKPESMDKFILSDADALITDEVEILQQKLKEYNEKPPALQLMDLLLQ